MNHPLNASIDVNEPLKKRVGLITPYTGFNLGDGAIQDAILHHLIHLDPSVEYFGITLYPADTENRHGIPSFPLTGLIIPNYSERELLFAQEMLSPMAKTGIHSVNKRGDDKETEPSLLHVILERLRNVKKLPLIGSALRFIIFRLRKMNELIIEGREIIRSYRFARKLDLLIISGGGQLDEDCGGPWGHPYALFRWAMIGKLSGTPLAISSVGSARIETGLTRWFLKKTLRSAIYRSYRDQGTKDQLSQWKFTQHDPIVPDLALSLDPTQYLSAGPRDDSQRVIAISPIYHTNPRYTQYESFVEAITDFIQWLIERGDHIILFRSTSIERFVINDIWKGLNKRFGDNISDRVKEVQTSRYQDMMTEISIADFVVASRLHSIILSHVLGIPTLGINWDRKVRAHMEDLNQNEYMINIESVNSELLIATFNRLEKDADAVRSTLDKFIRSYQAEFDRQYETLLKLTTS